MALLFMDGFQNYSANAHPPLRWGAGDGSWTWEATGGRFGQRCGRFGSVYTWIRKDLPSAVSGNTLIAGFSFRIPLSLNGSGDLAYVGESGIQHCGLRRETDNSISVIRAPNNGTQLTRSAGGVLVTEKWHFIEMKITIHDTAGSVEVRVDGVTVINATGLDTRNGGTGVLSTFGIGAIGWGSVLTGYIDTFYACDTTGSTNNDFLGDVRVIQLLPDAAGDSTQMTPSAGSNFQCVDENPFDGDTSYVQSDTVGHVDLYTVGNLPVNPSSIKGLQAVAVARKDDAGARDLIVKAKLGANTNNAAAKPLSTSYGFYSHIMEEKPGGGAWAKADVDSLQVGVEVA